MKKINLLFLATLLSVSCSSDENDNLIDSDIVNFKHKIVLIAGGPIVEGEVSVKVNHTYANGSSFEATHVFLSNGDNYTPKLDNTNSTKFILTNNSSSIMYFNFDAVRGDGKGDFLSPNESNARYKLEGKTSKIIVYSYDKKDYSEE